jgi:hypothetical protein
MNQRCRSASAPVLDAGVRVEDLRLIPFRAGIVEQAFGDAAHGTRIAAQVVSDPSGEPLACAMKALEMPSAVFQRVLLFLNPEFGSSVNDVYRLSRFYDHLSERSALIMLAAWRGATVAVTRAKYKPALYDDERQRARSAPAQTRPAVQPGADFVTRNNARGSGS